MPIMVSVYYPGILLIAIFSQAPVEGTWGAVLEAGPARLRLALHIARAADGSLGAKLDSIDQGAKGLPADSIELSGGTLRFTMKGLMVSYEGKLDPAGDEIRGTFTQAGASFPLNWKRGEPPAPKRPQEPRRPLPYREEEVRVENKAGGVRLAGTLTLPAGEGPFPAAVFITGSGAQDRDESLMGHRPFLVLSDALTRRGIATLRMDDRGAGGSTGGVLASTIEDFAGDTLAAVEYLKSRKEIRPSQIGLVGHSEGGVVAAIAAARSSETAFAVLISAPALPGAEIILLQLQLIARASGMDEHAVAKARKQQEEILAVVMQEKDLGEAEKKLRKLLSEAFANLPQDAVPRRIETQLKALLSSWYRHMLVFDPKTVIEKMTCPLLALAGELDLQVPPRENLPALAKALEAAGNRDYTIVKLPRLNHLLQTAKTGLPTEYGQLEETISPRAIEALCGWVVRRTAR